MDFMTYLSILSSGLSIEGRYDINKEFNDKTWTDVDVTQSISQAPQDIKINENEYVEILPIEENKDFLINQSLSESWVNINPATIGGEAIGKPFKIRF